MAVLKPSMLEWGSTSAKFGVAVMKASAHRSVKFGVVLFKRCMLDWGIDLPVHLPSLV